MSNSFDARSTLTVNGKDHEIYRLAAVPGSERLPYSLKILLENMLRHEDGVTVTKEDINAMAAWNPEAEPSKEIAYTPARVLMQDFTGVPAVVDLAAMRDAMQQLGGDPEKINPLQPAELVIDHSVQIDVFGTPDAVQKKRRNRIPAQSGTLQLPQMGSESLFQFQSRATGYGYRPPGQH